MYTPVWTRMMPQDCLAVWDIYIPAAVHRASTGVRSWRWCTSGSPHDCVQVCFQSCASASLFKAQHSLWTHGCLHNSGWDQSGRLEHLIVMWIDILLISRLSCGHNYYNDYNCYQVSGKSLNTWPSLNSHPSLQEGTKHIPETRCPWRVHTSHTNILNLQ